MILPSIQIQDINDTPNIQIQDINDIPKECLGVSFMSCICMFGGSFMSCICMLGSINYVFTNTRHK
jgi:hypothetical protein